MAKVQIPISNEAGLLQCSPANTNPDLTKGDAGKELRAKNPDKINYVRVATTDDIQGPAVAQYGVKKLGLKKVAIIDDTETYGKGLADAFAAEWTKLGGEVVGREGAPKGTTDYTAILTKFKDANPDAVFYGGVTATGGGLVRKQMPQAGLGDLVYLGGDGIQDGPGSVDGSFINIAGEAAANSFSSVAAIAEYPGKADFNAKYKAEYGEEAGAYSASGYACAQIVLQAIKTAASKGDVTREAVRVAATDPSTTFETVLGPVKFDAVGDTNQKIISLYKADLTAADGVGDWVFDSQVNYGEDVEVRLDLAVAVLADVLADHLVLVAGEELVEVALVLVVRVEPGVGIRADEVASGGGRLQQRDVVDVHAGRLGRVEDVRHVNEDGDVLPHGDSYVVGRSRLVRAARGRYGRRVEPAAGRGRRSVGPAGANPARCEAREARGVGGHGRLHG